MILVSRFRNKTMSKITVLGMGAMGSRMAISLLKAGHEITVWNRSVAKTDSVVKAGARVANTPRRAVKEAEFVISMVRDDEASERVWLDAETGALAGLSQNAIAIESSTLSPAWIKELESKFQQRGITFIDAPVAGTRPQAEAAQLIYFVGGDTATFNQTEPILKAMGSTVHHVGGVGNAMAIKLAVNALFAIQVAAMGELISSIRESKLDEAKAIAVITSTPVCSPAAKLAAKAIASGNFAPLFPIELVAKDLEYSLVANDNNLTLPLTEATRQVYAEAVNQGYGDNNITGIARLYI